MSGKLILMGVVGRAHGVRGLVRVHSYTESPEDLAGYSPLRDEQGRPWSLAWKSEGVAELRDATGKPLADRTAAEALVNTRLFVERARLPAATDDEYYLADLIGLAARAADGAALGSIAAVHDYGAGASLEIMAEGGASMLVPFNHASVPQVEIEAGFVVIMPPDEIVVAPEAGQSEESAA